MSTIHVDVVSAEKSIFEGEAKFVALPGETHGGASTVALSPFRRQDRDSQRGFGFPSRATGCPQAKAPQGYQRSTCSAVFRFV